MNRKRKMNTMNVGHQLQNYIFRIIILKFMFNKQICCYYMTEIEQQKPSLF